MDGRKVTTLQGLLKFALQYTKAEDAPNESTFQQMDPERREFLDNVLKSMTVDVIEEFRKAIEILELDESSTEEKLNALNCINDYINDIDIANNFIKIGGSKIIISCLNSDNSDIKAESANIIAELTQNNPFCQKHFTEQDILPKLIELLNDNEIKVCCAALYAISCLVRHYEQALAAFIKLGGVKRILDCLKYDESKFFVKACFLLNAISTEFPAVKDEFIKYGAFEKLSTFVEPSDEYNAKLETVLSTLSTLSSLEGVKTQIISEELSVKLRDIMLRSGDKPEYLEVVDYCKTLLDKSVENDAVEK